MPEDSLYAIEEKLEALQEQLQSCIELARDLSRTARGQISGPFCGQIDQYLTPWLEKFVNDSNQPGSIVSLYRMLENSKD